MDNSLSALWSLCSPGAVQGGLWIGLLVAGAAGSSMHCVPMCGSFVLGQVADQLGQLPAAQLCEWRRLRAGLLLPYHLGRLTTYAGLGALAAKSAGLLSRTPWFAAASSTLLLLAAALFLWLAGQRLLSLRFPATSAPRWLARGIGAVTRRIDRRGPIGGYLLGLALGILPCGFLYGALLAAASTAKPGLGAAAMLAFGLGTVPGLIVVGLAGQVALHRWRYTTSLASTPILLINAGMLLGLAWHQGLG